TVEELSRFNGTTWSPLGLNSFTNPTLKTVSDFTTWIDATGTHLVAAGSFALPGIAAWQQAVCQWSGSSWTQLGGTADDWIYTLCAFNDNAGPVIVAGGAFKNISGVPANRVAKWNGSAWVPMGPLYTATPYPGIPGAFLYSNLERVATS